MDGLTSAGMCFFVNATMGTVASAQIAVGAMCPWTLLDLRACALHEEMQRDYRFCMRGHS